MFSVNQITLLGHIGQAPELKYVGNGRTAKLAFSVATSDRWKDDAGNEREVTQWHHVDVWGTHAEALSKILRSGHAVYVQGNMRYHETEEGKRYANVRAESVIVVTPKDYERKPREAGR